MKRIILVAVLLSGSFYLKAQQAIKAIKAKNPGILNANFTAPVLAAYQVSANEKIEDFYRYLGLLCDKSISLTAKKEVSKNILILFDNREVSLRDFLSDSKSALTLPLFLAKVAETPSLKFEPENIVSDQLAADGWQVSYTLRIDNDGKVEQINLVQQIFLTKVVKTFGRSSKQVWQLFLGDVN